MVDVLPHCVEGEGLVLRVYGPDDATALRDAVTESIDHLRPWMPWIASEPVSIEDRAELIAKWAREHAVGGDAVYGIFDGARLVGGTGFHRRIGPDGLEIGYWVHVDHVGKGIATRASRVLTNAALALPGITRVEIHHDAANLASGAVPRRLGFTFVGEERREPAAPGETGALWIWRTVEPV